MKKINNAKLIQRLISRYDLKDATEEPFVLKENVQPVMNIDTLLRVPTLTKATAIQSTVAGWSIATYGSNDGVRKRLKAVSVARVAGTVNTIDAIGVGNGSVLVGIYYTAPAAEIGLVVGGDLVLEPEMFLLTRIATAEAASTVQCSYLFEPEVAY